MALSPWKKFANKVARAACVRKERDDLTPAEKIAGAEIVQKLQNFNQSHRHTDQDFKLLHKIPCLDP